MSKFSKGDKARVISVDDEDVKAGVKVGDIVTVAEDNTAIPFCVMSNGVVVVLIQDQIEHYIEPPKEITLNGATYVLKEEPKPEHEWKFGDIAIDDDYGVGIVLSTPDDENDVRFAYNGDLAWVNIEYLTFLRRADLSV